MRFLLAILLFAAVNAVAQTWPTRSVRIVVPATPGGAIDLIARTLAEKLTTSLGQPVVVENKPGASNNLGTDFVAKSPPDGYTLVIVASSHATNKHLFKQMPFDPIKDFEPVVYTHVVPLLLAVHPSVPAKNVPELVAWIKANPDKAVYASSGPGSSLHMAAELFMNMTKTKMHHVPYKGTQPHCVILRWLPTMPATGCSETISSIEVRAYPISRSVAPNPAKSQPPCPTGSWRQLWRPVSDK